MKTLIITFILAAISALGVVAVNDTNQVTYVFQKSLGIYLKSLGKEGDARRDAYFLEASNCDTNAYAWLMERLEVAQTIKVGSTFAELSKHFYLDGGPNGGRGDNCTFRCVMISCPHIKIDVQLADKDGKRVAGSIFDIIAADATVTKISKPYLEAPLGD